MLFDLKMILCLVLCKALFFLMLLKFIFNKCCMYRIIKLCLYRIKIHDKHYKLYQNEYLQQICT